MVFYLKRNRERIFSTVRVHDANVSLMCRNIRVLFNFDPPATPEEIRDASLQFVRKISGFNKPSKANEQSFWTAVDQVALTSTRLLHSMGTPSRPRNREQEIANAKARARKRFGGRITPSTDSVK